VYLDVVMENFKEIRIIYNSNTSTKFSLFLFLFLKMDQSNKFLLSMKRKIWSDMKFLKVKQSAFEI